MLTLTRITDRRWKEIFPKLPQKWAPEPIANIFEKVGHGGPRAAGASWVVVIDDALYVLGPGEKSPEKTGVAATALRIHDIASDGKRILVAGTEDIYEVDVGSRKSRVVVRLPGEAYAGAIVYLAGARAALVHGRTLLFLETGEAWREIASMPLDGARDLLPLRARTLLVTIASGTYGGRPPIAYRVLPDGLTEIDRADAQFMSSADELDGHVYVTDTKWRRHELLGLPDAPEAARPSVAAEDFIFYGETAGDWYEGANLGHPYELVFREIPSDAAKAKIAKLFQKETSKGALEGAPNPWMWSGRFALFFVGQRSAKSEKFFEAIPVLLGKIHAIAPLAEVLFRGTRADSRKYPHPPTPGPRYPKLTFPPQFGATFDESLPMAAPDPAFEAARVTKKSK